MPSQVITFSTPQPESGAPVPPQRRLIWLSRALATLFAAFVGLSVLWILAAAAVTAFFSDHVLTEATGVWLFVSRPPHIPGAVLFSAQPPLTRVTGVVDVVFATIPVLFVFCHLRQLFLLYGRGIVFARENAAHLKRVGFWLVVVYPFTKLAANMLFRLAGGSDKAWFHMELIYTLVLGLIVFAIAQVMEFGHEIEQEKDSFV